MKLKLKDIGFSLILCLAILGAIVASNSPAGVFLGVAATCSGITGCVTTPSLFSSTSYSYTLTTITTSTTTSSSFSTSISSSTTTTTASTTTTWFSYTSTLSTTVFTTSYTTSYTGTSSSTNTNWVTVSSTSSSPTTYTNLVTVKGSSVPSCPIAEVTGGSPLEPYANVLRNFRNNAIQNTTAGREFLLTFNTWYYSWAPSLSYSTANNPWLFQAVQAGVYPLIGVLYASYYSYALIAPFSAEAGAITAGIVAASLIGAIYLAPGAYLAVRIMKRHGRLLISKQVAFSSSIWFGASVLTCVVAYVTGSGVLLAFATSSIALSMLSLGSLLGVKVLTGAQLPITNVANAIFAFKRLSRLQF